MFDHIVFSVSDFNEASDFFLKALAPLGVTIVSDDSLGIELCRPNNDTSLCIRRVEKKTSPLHLAFSADNRQQVRDFYHAALQAGALDNGPPGLRSEYHAHYYAAFVIGPDEHNIEVVCHHCE